MTLLFLLNLGFAWSSVEVVTFGNVITATLEDENPDRTLASTTPARTVTFSG
jgi:hypothetical protein